MPLILTLLENEVPMQVLCENLAWISRAAPLTFNGFQIGNESIRDSHKNMFWKV